MEAELVNKAAEAAATTTQSVQTTSLGVWDFLIAYPWIMDFAKWLAICTIIWRAAKFYALAIHTEKELKVAQEENRENKKAAQDLKDEIERRDTILVKRGLLYVKHDPVPLYPICPSCYSVGRIIRMMPISGILPKKATQAMRTAKELGGNPNILGAFDNCFGFFCPSCDCEFQVSDTAFDKFESGWLLDESSRECLTSPSKPE